MHVSGTREFSKYNSSMYHFVSRMLSTLLLGQLIAGVNHEIQNTLAVEYSPISGILSEETTNILHYHYKLTYATELKGVNEEDFLPVSFSRQKRSDSSSFCPPHDSCSGRCGQQVNDFPYTCNCDALCSQFLDCCIDYDEHCGPEPGGNSSDSQLASIQGLRCEILFMKFNLLVVNKCPDYYGNTFRKELCSVQLPKDCVFRDNDSVRDSAEVFARCKDSVHRNCMLVMQSQCNVNVEPQCVSAITRKCSVVAFRKCRRCHKSYWPVFGEDGIVYKNSYCALCNSQEKYTTLSPYDLKVNLNEAEKSNASEGSIDYFARSCVPVGIDSCPDVEKDQEVQELCHNYSGAVISRAKRGLIYKNLHCATCHGENVKDIECATKASMMRGLIRPLLENFITGDVQGMKLDDIPAAFSILLNFGLDGRERMYFSSEGEENMRRHQEKCGEGRIWDPFSEVCRRLYCSTEFVLVDYRCVKKESPNEEVVSRNETSVIPDARADFVHLTLSAEVEMLDFLQFHGQGIEEICDTIRASLANSFDINIDRIRGVRFNISLGDFNGMNETFLFIEEMSDLHPITLKIDFDLYEDHTVNVSQPEPSVDSIVLMLATSLSINGFEFDIKNVTSRIFEIHQTVSPLTSWCSRESGGQMKEYWNSEFSLILDEEASSVRESQIKGIYVNKTEKFYPRGKFIADILFQGYQFSGSLINVSGVAVVCDKETKLNESCIRILLDEEEYSILENGSLSIHNESLRNVVDDSTYDVAENNSLWVCIKSLNTVGKSNRYRMDMDFVQAWVSFVLLWISVIAMAIVLVTYVAFENLRNLPGCNTMNLTFSLMAMQITFLFGQRGTVRGTACVVVGHLLHYEILCCFMWMNVMAFDLFKTFGNRNILSNIRRKSKYLPLYMAYAYLSPMLIILITSLMDYFVDNSPFAPLYGRNNACWITNQYAAITFFAVPLAVVMIVNFVFFLLTVLAMRSVKSLKHLKDNQTNRRGRSDLFLYARMAMVIGLTWALSFAAALVRKKALGGQVLTYLFIIFNTLQGVFIFCVFVCNRRVYEMYREAFRKVFRGTSKQENSSEILSKLKNAMKRSVSSNTVVSTLSNASSLSNTSQLSSVLE